MSIEVIEEKSELATQHRLQRQTVSGPTVALRRGATERETPDLPLLMREPGDFIALNAWRTVD
jgi:hypothetical protein